MPNLKRKRLASRDNGGNSNSSKPSILSTDALTAEEKSSKSNLQPDPSQPNDMQSCDTETSSKMDVEDSAKMVNVGNSSDDDNVI